MATIHLPKSTSDLLKLGSDLLKCYENSSDNFEQKYSIVKYIDELRSKLTYIEPKYEELNYLRNSIEILSEEIKRVTGTHESNRKISPDTVKFAIAQIRDVLKIIYRDDLGKLREWGFTVEKNSLKKAV